MISYYPNGRTDTEANQSNRSLQGEYKKYYPNGQVKNEGRYENGVRNGKFTSYYEDGSLEKDLNIVDDKMTGVNLTYFLMAN